MFEKAYLGAVKALETTEKEVQSAMARTQGVQARIAKEREKLAVLEDKKKAAVEQSANGQWSQAQLDEAHPSCRRVPKAGRGGLRGNRSYGGGLYRREEG